MTDLAFDMASKLDGRAPRRAGRSWLCRCPAHDDRNPSLGITARQDKLLYKCWAGCSFDEIAAAVRARGFNPFTGGPDDGWRPGDEKRPGSARPRPRGRSADEEEAVFRAGFEYDPGRNPEWPSLPAASRPAPFGYGHIRYVYRDAAGLPTMVVHRYDKLDPTEPGRDKELVTISPWTRKSDRALVLPPRSAPPPMSPYGSETLKRPGTVWILEGEKCRDAADALMRHRFPVVSTYGSMPAQSDLSCLAGRTVVIVRDHDKPGQRYADECIALLGESARSIPSPWRGSSGEPPPKGWDLADDVAGRGKSTTLRFNPLTLREFADHVANCATEDHQGLVATAAAELAALL